MPRRAVPAVLILLAVTPSCSDGDRPGPSDADSSRAAASASGAGQGGDPVGAGGTSGAGANGGSASAGGPSSAAGGRGDGSMPPPSATLCGQGSFTKDEAIEACNADSKNVVRLPLAQCDLLGIDGGAWEAWCSSTSLVYFWIRFDGAATLDPDMEVILDGGLPAMLIELVGDVTTATAAAPNTPTYAGKVESDITLDWDLSDLPMAMPAGAGHLWVTGSYTNHTSIFDQVLVSGATFDWAAP